MGRIGRLDRFRSGFGTSWSFRCSGVAGSRTALGGSHAGSYCLLFFR